MKILCISGEFFIDYQRVLDGAKLRQDGELTVFASHPQGVQPFVGLISHLDSDSLKDLLCDDGSLRRPQGGDPLKAVVRLTPLLA